MKLFLLLFIIGSIILQSSISDRFVSNDRFTSSETIITVNDTTKLKNIFQLLYEMKVPYVWGKFDCSKAMQMAYKQIGIYLPRVSRDQYKFVKLSNNNVLRENLVFFGKKKVFHVGFSPNYQQKVKDNGNCLLLYHNANTKKGFRIEKMSNYWKKQIKGFL